MSSTRSYHFVVLVKQVPDTHTITRDVMRADGTLNRSALPAIFNPEDLNALEMALQLRDRYAGQVSVLTMGPPSAASVLREALYRGADRVILLSDKKFAGADTLATSYTLKCALEKLGTYDLVFCGRQAIDGDTAQVGPQLAEKLDIPQITYAESVERLEGDTIVAVRTFPLGKEWVECRLPCLLTVVASANRPRPPSARKRIEYKLAASPLEYPALLRRWPEWESEQELDAYLAARKLKIPTWTADDLPVDPARLGLAGSPTQVYKVNFVVLETTDSKQVPDDQAGATALMQELIREYIVG